MAIPLYRLFLWAYVCGARLIAPFNLKARRWLAGRKDVFAALKSFRQTDQRPVIWFHCASLGEFEQGRPLLEALRAAYSSHAIVLSFFSPSGYEVRKQYEGADFVTYLPMDGPQNAAKFVTITSPALVCWVKYEYWHYYLQAIHRQSIPLLLISGILRKEQPFFRWWGKFHRSMLGCFTAFFVQDDLSKKLLGSIGFSSNVIVSGDTRFDRVIEIAGAGAELSMIEKFIDGQPVIVAGSTWEEDEEELDHFANTHRTIKFIIAPHEIDEDHLQDIEKLFHHTIRYSAFTSADQTLAIKAQNANVLIIDNIGMLSRLYKYASIAYVGGGFGDDGVHNVLEAAVYYKPVVFGPVYEKFIEAAELVDAGAAFDIDNALELEEVLQHLLKNSVDYHKACEAAGAYVYAKKGATDIIRNYIQENRLLTS